MHLANDFIVGMGHVEACLDEKAHLGSAQLNLRLRGPAKICMAGARHKVKEFFSAFLLHLLLLHVLIELLCKVGEAEELLRALHSAWADDVLFGAQDR